MPKFTKRYDKPKRGSARSEARERGRNNTSSGGMPSKESGFELHVTNCDKCGRKCDVPFKPTQGKPIYCRSCFRGTTPEESGRAPVRGGRFESRDRPMDRFEPRERNNDVTAELDDIKRKLDKIMKALKIN